MTDKQRKPIQIRRKCPRCGEGFSGWFRHDGRKYCYLCRCNSLYDEIISEDPRLDDLVMPLDYGRVRW